MGTRKDVTYEFRIRKEIVSAMKYNECHSYLVVFYHYLIKGNKRGAFCRLLGDDFFVTRIDKTKNKKRDRKIREKQDFASTNRSKTLEQKIVWTQAE